MAGAAKGAAASSRERPSDESVGAADRRLKTRRAAQGDSGRGRRAWDGIGQWRRRLFGADGSAAAGDALPAVYRLAVVYLLLPVAIWLLGWFEWWFGIPAVAVLGAGLWRMLGGSWRLLVGPAAVVLPLFALLCGVLTAFGVFDADSFDSPGHRAVFLALAHNDWPPYLADYLSDQSPLLRYYLGYYIVPALAGKWLGLDALNWAVPLWTWGGIALVFALCVQGLPTLRAMLLAAAVFVFFSGMDVLEYVLRDGLPDAVRRLGEQFGVETPKFIRSPSSSAWAAYHAYGVGDPASLPSPASPMFLEYLPNVHLLAVTPQHFIGGGLTTLLMLRLCDQPRFLAASGIVLASCLFWSSLLCFGLLPLIAAMLLKNGVAPFLGWRNLLLAPALALLLALYLTSGQVDFPSGWLWSLYASGFQLAADVAIFYLAEFLVLAFLVCWLHPRLCREPFFVAAVAVLLAAPWFWYGSPRFNEFFRAAIPAVFVLGYYAAHTVAGRLPEAQAGAFGVGNGNGGRRWLAADFSERAVFALLAVVLSIGAVTSVFELAKVNWLRSVPFGSIGAALTDFPAVAAQRTAPSVPAALAALLRDSPGQSATRGERVIRSDYDVYLDGGWLVYAKRECDEGVEARRRFRLRAFFVESAAAGAGRPAAANLDFFLHHRAVNRADFVASPDAGRGGCVARARLPEDEIARIHTGQHEPSGAVVWEAGYDFETKEQFSAPDFYLSEYQAIVALAPPAARSDFDVYVGDGQLGFVKTPCGASDPQARFVVHLYPADSADLPRGRRRYGFDNLDFDFAEHGVAFDGTCLATIPLPEYAVVRIVAGQFVGAENRILWRVGFPMSRSEDDGDG